MLAQRAVADPSDRELLAAVARGQPEALGSLYDRHAARALGLAMRVVGERGPAEEIVQDAFVSAWCRAPSYQPAREEPADWILALVRHRALEQGRAAAGPPRPERRGALEAGDTLPALTG